MATRHVATRLVVLAGLVVGVFLLWVDAAHLPDSVPLRERIVEGPPVLFGAILVSSVWVYCFYWACRTRSWEWVVIDVMLPIALPVHILSGPVSRPHLRLG